MAWVPWQLPGNLARQGQGQECHRDFLLTPECDSHGAAHPQAEPKNSGARPKNSGPPPGRSPPWELGWIPPPVGGVRAHAPRGWLAQSSLDLTRVQGHGAKASATSKSSFRGCLGCGPCDGPQAEAVGVRQKAGPQNQAKLPLGPRVEEGHRPSFPPCLPQGGRDSRSPWARVQRAGAEDSKPVTQQPALGLERGAHRACHAWPWVGEGEGQEESPVLNN